MHASKMSKLLAHHNKAIMANLHTATLTVRVVGEIRIPAARSARVVSIDTDTLVSETDDGTK